MEQRWMYAVLILMTLTTLCSCRLSPMWSDSCPVPITESVFDPAHCDCSDIFFYCLDNGRYPESGVYTVYYGDPLTPIQVYCDMDTEGGGWTVFQRRITGDVHFYRGWDDYVQGFGNPQGDYWLGLQYLHWLTENNRPLELRIELEGDPEETGVNELRAAHWSTFGIAGPEDDYRLDVGGYSSPEKLGDSMSYHDNRAFSTLNNDNDGYGGGNCARSYKGGWWYVDEDCFRSNLNGLYLDGDHTTMMGMGMEWLDWDDVDQSAVFGHNYSYLSSNMKVRWLLP